MRTDTDKDTMKARINKITIGRLYNLGSYEHIRYELTVEVPEGESAETAILGLERILDGLAPFKNSVSSEIDIKRKAEEIARMKVMPYAEWQRHYGHCTGSPAEVIERFEAALNENIDKRNAALAKAKRARELFDDLGGASKWRDAKLEWDEQQDDY